MKHFLIFLFLISMAYAGEEKKEALELKRQEKLEHRLSHQETALKKRFERKRSAIEKKYHRRLKRLEKQKDKVSPTKYEKALTHLNHWYAREEKQLKYEEEHAYKRMTSKKETLK